MVPSSNDPNVSPQTEKSEKSVKSFLVKIDPKRTSGAFFDVWWVRVRGPSFLGTQGPRVPGSDVNLVFKLFECKPKVDQKEDGQKRGTKPAEGGESSY